MVVTYGDDARIEVVPPTAATPIIDDDGSALAARLEAVSLGGLADAAEALLGDDAVRVGAMLAAWELHGCGQLPRVTPACWTALNPFGLSRPPGAAPRVLDELLAGVAAELSTVLDALADCRDRADRASSGSVSIRPPDSGNRAVELWSGRLVAAVADFWAQTAELFAAVRPSVLLGDHDEVRRLIGLARGRLRTLAERIEALASRTSSGPPPPAASSAIPSAAIGSEGAAEPAAGGAALLRSQPARVGAAAPGGELHEWGPIAFLAAATTLALIVLLFILLS